MSGGSLNYGYLKINEVASLLSFRAKTPLQRELEGHLHLVAEALYITERVLSGDCAEGEEEAAIRACLPPEAETEEPIPTLKEGRNHIKFQAPDDGTVYATLNYVKASGLSVDIEDGVALTSAAHPGTEETLFIKMHAIADAVERLAMTVQHRAFALHLHLAAQAIYAVEQRVLGAFSEGEDDDLIAACLPRYATLKQALIEAYTADANLKLTIAAAEKKLTVGEVFGETPDEKEDPAQWPAEGVLA